MIIFNKFMILGEKLSIGFGNYRINESTDYYIRGGDRWLYNIKNIQMRIFSYGMNHPVFLAQHLNVPVEEIEKTAIPCILPNHQCCMAALRPEERDCFFYATVIPREGHQVIGYSFIVSDEVLAGIDDWEDLGLDYHRVPKLAINPLTNEEVEVQVYVKTEDHPISVLAVKERMDYLFDCYLTQRYFLKLMGQLDDSDVWNYHIVCGAKNALIGKFEVPLSIDESAADEFFKLNTLC